MVVFVFVFLVVLGRIEGAGGVGSEGDVSLSVCLLLRTDFKRREDSQKSTILSRTAAVFELPIRSGRNTPHPHLKPPLPPPQPPAPPSSPTLGAVVGHGGMLAGWWLVGGGVVEETRKQTTVARG